MSIKQRFHLFMTILWGVVIIVLLVRMILLGDYRLWAAELALLCAFAVSLRGYALEWRRLKDEQERLSKQERRPTE